MSLFADVILDLPYPAGKKRFTYLIKEEHLHLAQVGIRVKVPFGRRNREKTALILDLKENGLSDLKVKPILSYIDPTPIFSSELLSLGQWLSDRTVSTYWSVFSAMLPGALKINEQYVATAVKFSSYQPEFISDNDWSYYQTICRELSLVITKEYQTAARLLERVGLIRISLETKSKSAYKYEAIYHALLNHVDELDESPVKEKLSRSPIQKDIMLSLIVQGEQSVKELRYSFKEPKRALEALEKKGLVSHQMMRLSRLPVTNQIFNKVEHHDLTQEQETVLDEITKRLALGSFHSFLLHGVTGSGKTEVYLRAARKAREQNKQVLILVPEISLTAPIIGRFSAGFPEDVAFLHSQLTDVERYEQWQQIKDGEKNIVIGVRSAVFAPLERLGLVIVDESHDSSYKQSEPEPRYHARLVAEKRAVLQDAVFIAGSATPSIETMYRAYHGNTQLLRLTQRVNDAEMPAVDVVDMRSNSVDVSIFSDQLLNKVRQTLTDGQQVILYLNKRGYSSFLMCRECGQVVKCSKCDIALTHYRSKEILRCHYCQEIKPIPRKCPNCGSTHVGFYGTGIEQVYEAFKKEFPNVRIDRLDSDVITRANQHQDIIARMQSGETEVLIGTQMVSKGFHFPNVTLVGVIHADISLHMPDYRAAERTFQQLTQVAGRAGRGEHPGQVLVQTYMPEHPAIVAAAHQDYFMFYDREIEVRRQLQYPPFVHILRIILSDMNQENAILVGREITQTINSRLEHNAILLGLSPAPIERIQNRYRFQIIVKCGRLSTLQNLANWVKTQYTSSRISKTLRLMVDIDPENIL